MTTKIHACTDALGNALRLLVSEGQAGDALQFTVLLAGLKPKMAIADTSYDSDTNRAYCAQEPIEAVIPNRPDPTTANLSYWMRSTTKTATRSSASSTE